MEFAKSLLGNTVTVDGYHDGTCGNKDNDDEDSDDVFLPGVSEGCGLGNILYTINIYI